MAFATHIGCWSDWCWNYRALYSVPQHSRAPSNLFERYAKDRMVHFPLFPNENHPEQRKDNDHAGSNDNDENDSKDDDKETGIWEWFEKQLEKDKKNDYNVSTSFHTLYVRSDMCRILMEIEREKLEDLFFVTLSNDGYEGSLPDQWDETPKNVGLQFRVAPNGRQILLVEAQDRLAEDDFAASMYDPVTGGLRGGYIKVFHPVVDDKVRNSVLLDVTSWIADFSKYILRVGPGMFDSCDEGYYSEGDVGGGFGMLGGNTMMLDLQAFPNNFFARFATQRSPSFPLKQGGDRTSFFTASFMLLPKLPMVPRPWDRRVGFFTTAVHTGSPTQITKTQYCINRWNLSAKPHITYVIDPAVPQAYVSTIKRAVSAWNRAFVEAGFSPHEPVVQCVAPGEPGFPEDYARGDARFNAIYMTDPKISLYGYGPSVVDFRSGEILTATVLLGFSPFTEVASQHSLAPLTARQEGVYCGCCHPLLEADHPGADVLKGLFKTVVHEVGHTLGLRHNFISASDNYSSVMDYVDPLDTSDPTDPVFGGYYATDIGEYDVYAIRYGYTPVLTETRSLRHPALALLGQGQSVTPATVKTLDDAREKGVEAVEELVGELLAKTPPSNPLFATDEAVHYDDFDPRVNRWGSQVELVGQDKLKYSFQRRRVLLELVSSGSCLPETYSARVRALLAQCSRAIGNGANFVGASLVDDDRLGFLSPFLAKLHVHLQEEERQGEVAQKRIHDDGARDPEVTTSDRSVVEVVGGHRAKEEILLGEWVSGRVLALARVLADFLLGSSYRASAVEASRLLRARGGSMGGGGDVAPALSAWADGSDSRSRSRAVQMERRLLRLKQGGGGGGGRGGGSRLGLGRRRGERGGSMRRSGGGPIDVFGGGVTIGRGRSGDHSGGRGSGSRGTRRISDRGEPEGGAGGGVVALGGSAGVGGVLYSMAPQSMLTLHASQVAEFAETHRDALQRICIQDLNIAF